MKILFITPYSTEGASNRYRVEQYLPYLEKKGFECKVRPFVSSEFYKIIYKKRNLFKKIYFFIKGIIGRVEDVINAKQYDLIFIHREACPFGPPVFEWLMYRTKIPIIFDFDDAIFLYSYHPANSMYRFLKFPSKTKSIIKMSKTVIVANEFLKDYASRFNSNVYIIFTSIDSDKFDASLKEGSFLTVGWVGSPTTAPYLRIVYKVLQDLSRKYDFIVKIVGAEGDISISGVRIENLNWQLNREVLDFQSIDIGIYPLIDTLWARGKAAFKAIQYMAVGVPVVASPVGMTKEVIQDGVNGFLANSEKEWIAKLSELIEDPNLRKRIGSAGRKVVEEKFSVTVNAPKLLNILKQIVTK